MKTLLYGLLILPAFIAMSCTDNSYTGFVESALRAEVPGYEKYDTIFIITRRGCNSCTNQADRIFKTRGGNKQNLFIFTNLESEKRLRIELSKDRLQQDNVFVDHDKRFWTNKFVEAQYPTALIRNDNGEYEFKYMLDILF